MTRAFKKLGQQKTDQSIGGVEQQSGVCGMPVGGDAGRELNECQGSETGHRKKNRVPSDGYSPGTDLAKHPRAKKHAGAKLEYKYRPWLNCAECQRRKKEDGGQTV